MKTLYEYRYSIYVVTSLQRYSHFAFIEHVTKCIGNTCFSRVFQKRVANMRLTCDANNC